MSNEKKVELGKTYTDSITGFKGVAIGHVEYLTGCNQVLLSPKGKEAHTRPSSEWFDTQRVGVDDAVAKVVLDNGETPGADRAAPVA